MFAFLRTAFTERDNLTFDIKRVLWAIGFVWGLGLETFAVIHAHRAFDLVTFAAGVSGLLLAGGATLAMNRKNENGADQ
jgi:hypothetical protein